MSKVSNEKKQLTRLAGEFLVASRFAQRGYMVALQWGTTIGYDILVFDKSGKDAFLEVKTCQSYKRDWALQRKYLNPEVDKIPLGKRFVACVNMFNTIKKSQCVPEVYIFPAQLVAKGLRFRHRNKVPKSSTLDLPLDKRPTHQARDKGTSTVGEFMNAKKYLENYDIVPVDPVKS